MALLCPFRIANVYNVMDYGAHREAATRFTSGGEIAASSYTFTDDTGPFVLGDVGKDICVQGAVGAGAGSLCTTIAAFTSATTVTLTNYATATVTDAEWFFGRDDTNHVQDAIDACAAAGGGDVYMPAGTYYLQTYHQMVVGGGGNGVNLELASNVRLRGDGPGATILTSGPLGVQAIGATAKSNIAVLSLTVSNIYGYADAIKLFVNSGVTVRNVTMPGMSGAGLNFGGCNNATAIDCTASGTVGSTATTFGFSAGTNDTYFGLTPDGTYCRDITFENCTATAFAQAGFRLSGDTTTKPDAVAFNDCYAYDCQSAGNPPWPRGFFVTKATNVNMTDCRAWNSNTYNVEYQNTTTGAITNTGYKTPGGTAAVLTSCSGVTETGAHVDS